MGVHGTLHGGRVTHVAHHAPRAAADLLRGGLDLVLLAAGQGDAVTLGGERLRHGEADALAGTRHERTFLLLGHVAKLTRPPRGAGAV